jgi:hypothetical protein
MESEILNTELWKAEYYKKDCDSLISVHRILCRTIKLKNVKVGKQNYISVMLLNQKFNL